MTRDDEFIRALLLEAEASPQPCIIAGLVIDPDPDDLKRHVHSEWLCDAGLFVPVGRDTYRITNQGHDYLAAIRDEGVWRRTKDVGRQAGGISLSLMVDVAGALLKEKVGAILGGGS